jgi:hypothetical protein
LASGQIARASSVNAAAGALHGGGKLIEPGQHR